MHQHEKTISFSSLRKAHRVVATFVNTFFPLIDLSVSRYLDMHHVLLWVEAVVYDMDRIVERGQREAGGKWSVDQEMAVLTSVLEQQGLLTPAAQAQLSNFVRYFEQETALLQEEGSLTLERVREAWRLRSSDLRLLASLTAHMAGIADWHVSHQALKGCLDCIWQCAEVVSDAPDYEEDLKNGSFNTLHLFVRLHGREQARRLLLEELDGIRARLESTAAALAPQQRELVMREADEWWKLLWKIPEPT
jgi:hypothetical protein